MSRSRRPGDPLRGKQLPLPLDWSGRRPVVVMPAPTGDELRCACCGARITIDDVTVSNDRGVFCLELRCQRDSERWPVSAMARR